MTEAIEQRGVQVLEVRIIQILRDLFPWLPLASLTPQARLVEDFGLDERGILGFLIMIQYEFNLSLDSDDCETLGDVCARVTRGTGLHPYRVSDVAKTSTPRPGLPAPAPPKTSGSSHLDDSAVRFNETCFTMNSTF